MHTFGGNVRWAHPNYHLGITAVYYTFGGKTMYPQEQLYNRFAFRGEKNVNMSVDYMWKTGGENYTAKQLSLPIKPLLR